MPAFKAFQAFIKRAPAIQKGILMKEPIIGCVNCPVPSFEARDIETTGRNLFKIAEEMRLKRQGELGVLLTYQWMALKQDKREKDTMLELHFQLIELTARDGYIESGIFHEFSPVVLVKGQSKDKEIRLCQDYQVGGDCWHFLFQRPDGVGAWVELNVKTGVLVSGSVQFPWPLTLDDLASMVYQIKMLIQSKGLNQ
jgi:hypothetical protein